MRGRAGTILSSLFVQVLIAALIGIAVGHFRSGFGESFEPTGDDPTRLIKMVIAPLVFCVVVVDIARAGHLRSVGRVGLEAMSHFEVAHILVLPLGLVAGNVLRSGNGLDIPRRGRIPQRSGGAGGEELPEAVQFPLDPIPESAIGPSRRKCCSPPCCSARPCSTSASTALPRSSASSSGPVE